MVDQPAGQGSDERISKAELLAKINQSRARLEASLGQLSESQLTQPGPEGWSIKDHLAHLAAWELGMAELLNRGDRFAAMQVEEVFALGNDQNKNYTDEINALIYQHHAGQPYAQVLAEFQDAHRQMLAALNVLSDADLYRNYADYTPDGEGPQAPVINWIIGNTAEHYDEHTQYIQNLLQSERKG